MRIIREALARGQTSLSEYESKKVLSAYEVPVTREILVHDAIGLVDAARTTGYPVVLKGCSQDMAHKTEAGLVRVDIRNEKDALVVFQDITGLFEWRPLQNWMLWR